jgi:hypothetical protein
MWLASPFLKAPQAWAVLNYSSKQQEEGCVGSSGDRDAGGRGGHSKVMINDHSKITINDHSQVIINDHSQVIINDHSKVVINDHRKVIINTTGRRRRWIWWRLSRGREWRQ